VTRSSSSAARVTSGADADLACQKLRDAHTLDRLSKPHLVCREVLIVCPASLKSQWRSEIQRFSERTTELVSGPARDRARAYGSDAFFTVCNYEQVLKDILHIEKTRWDLIVLDEGQRIKNWEAKTSRIIKGLASRFALVLTGTPLENRLDDLHSVVAFVDPHRGADVRPAIADAFRTALDAKVIEDDRGQPRLSLALPSREALAGLLRGIAGLLVGAPDGESLQPHSQPHSAAEV
jgi:hypothetical protein